MKKLFKLRDWLTLDEAAEHLSMLFGENVTRAELLRLALDGEFTLSVRFVNAVYGKGGPVISSRDARRSVIPGLNGETIHICDGIFIDAERVIDLRPEVKALTGIWDLPMIGAEQLDLEHEYQVLTGGPSLDAVSLEGAFIRDNGVYWQLLEHFSNNEYFDKKNLREPWNNPDNFYPASGLPDDAIYVVRMNSLRDLIQRARAAEQEGPSSVANKACEPAALKKEPLRAGGRPRSGRWPDWVAELAFHLHENGYPLGDGAAGQDSLIAAVESRLIQRGREAPGRTTVQETVRAVLVRYREAGN